LIAAPFQDAGVTATGIVAVGPSAKPLLKSAVQFATSADAEEANATPAAASALAASFLAWDIALCS
jgi:hypothetical protein